MLQSVPDKNSQDPLDSLNFIQTQNCGDGFRSRDLYMTTQSGWNIRCGSIWTLNIPWREMCQNAVLHRVSTGKLSARGTHTIDGLISRSTRTVF